MWMSALVRCLVDCDGFSILFYLHLNMLPIVSFLLCLSVSLSLCLSRECAPLCLSVSLVNALSSERIGCDAYLESAQG